MPCCTVSSIGTWPSTRLYLESVASHALAVLVDEAGALLLGVVGGGEEHALVALGFLVGAYLEATSVVAHVQVRGWESHAARLDLCRSGGGVLQVCAHVGGGWRCCHVSD